MNLSNLNLEDIQILAAAAAAANHAQVQQQQMQASMSRQATPPITPIASSSTTPKASANNTRTPTPTQNGANSSSQHNMNVGALDPQSQSKYQQLLSVIEEMGKDIRPTYAGSKSSAERLKRGIVYARILVRECLVETERSART